MFRRSSSSPLVGRQAELAVLDAARLELAKSRGAVVLIAGEAGIGKTRLLGDFVRSLGGGRPRNVVTAECLERIPQPFGPIRTVVEALQAVVPEGDLPANVRRGCAQLLGRIEAQGRNGAAPLEKADLFTALVAYLKLVSERRATIVAIEDLHWADASTLEFVTFLAPRLESSRLLLIATYRSDRLADNAALVYATSRLARESCARTLLLEPLASFEIRSVIASALGAESLPKAAERDIEERCEGNPFFAEELLKSALRRRAASSSAPLPLSIRATILERLTALTEEERRILAHAAVLGYRFDPDVLALVMQTGVDSLLPCLRRARDLHILTEERGARVRCRFRHAVTRQTIYEDMLAYDARRLHQRILAALEAQGDADRHIEELAYHAWEAKDRVRGLRHNESAGVAALGLRALPEARLCFARALEFAVDDADEARLLERTGNVAQLQGRLRESLEFFASALDLRLRRKDYDAAAPLVTWMAGDRHNLGEAEPHVEAERFLLEYGDRLSRPPRDVLAVFIARLLSARFEFAAVERLLSDVAPDQLPPRVRQNYSLIELNRHVFRGDVAAWKRSLRDFYEFLPMVPEFLRVISLYTIAQTATFLGANPEAERALAEADRLVSEWRFEGIAQFGAAVRAEYLWYRGRLREAAGHVESVLEAEGPAVAHHVVAHVAPLLALALDDESLAVRTLDHPSIAAAIQQGQDIESILGARGAWHGAYARSAEARSALHAALAAVETATPFCSVLFAACARNSEGDDVVRVLELTEVEKLHPDDVTGRANASLVRAIVAQRRNETEVAEHHALDAARGYARLDWPLFQAQALELAGKPDEARVLYERCGAVAYVRRLSAPLELPRALASPRDLLTSRESEIAELVTRGLTNSDIAARLFVSNKTVEKHLSAIFAKLAVRSRAQLAAFVAREEGERRIQALG